MITWEGAAGRVAAALALGSAAVHVASLHAASLGSLAAAGMALACLPCAWHLWRAPSRSVWATTVLLDLGMLAVHAPTTSSAGHGTVPWPGLVLVTASLLLGLVVLTGAVRTAAGRPCGAEAEQTAGP
ncbi:hypothetical protein [Geodermatophilus sp. TF02-6]|uniref:hypothetical protein n=1 Tax=Geodermatophilus sp. TF02-6 TaxID=2250575 RepID=UPI0011BDF152|nr:hypothetical protein [Geodermatophilus sp. TF02-6]